MPDELIFEVCVDSVESAIAAQAGGAHRVELCDNLVEGGTTPSAGTIAMARKHLDIGIQVIIRPRGGDFCYSDVEFEIMKYDIERAKQLGADGVVIGLLNPDGTIDVERTRELVDLARPMSVTFHRAFDMTRDPHQALEDLISLGIDRVLTSGQEISVLEGLDLIIELVKQADGRIIIMPGGGITERNVNKIVQASGVTEFHATSTVSAESAMNYRNTRVFMGGELRPPEYSRLVTDAGRVKSFLDAVDIES
ncbi:MAG: copper homeostasis protein CutC [Phototrophicales bacterium]|nr:MAG: copper homeostasis protein CutC [Phototrophicales bacterium]